MRTLSDNKRMPAVRHSWTRFQSSMFAQSDRQRTVREVRTQIARELRDTLLQTFLNASMQLGAAVDSLPSDSPVKLRLDQILKLIDQGIIEGRNAIQCLRSSDSRGVDLELAFSRVPQEIGVPPEIQLRLVVAGREQPLRARIANEIYHIGREALVNAFRHSRANRVELEQEYAHSDLCMRVRDDGCGIDTRMLYAGREGHWSLIEMRERAAKIGALLKISSSATQGSEIQLLVPNAGTQLEP